MTTKTNNRMIDGAAVNVLDFGADPTGATDSTSAIRSAIYAGSVIIFPEGTYQFNPNTPVDVFSRKVLIGQNATLNGMNSSAFNITDSLEMYDLNLSGNTDSLFDVSGDMGDIILERCKIDGAGLVYGSASSLDLLRMIDCDVTNTPYYTFRLRADINEAQIHRNRFSDTTVTGSSVSVLELGNSQLADQPNSGHYYITNNTFENIIANGTGAGETHAILLYGSFAHVHENTVTNVDRPNDPQSGGVEGIYTKVRYGSICNNVLYRAGNSEGNKGSMIAVKGFPKDDPATDAKGYYLTVNGNVCVGDSDKAYNGIRAESDRITISDNVIQRCQYSIIYAPVNDYAADVVISDNVITEATGVSGIRINCGGDDISVQGNRIGVPSANPLSTPQYGVEFTGANRTGEINRLSISNNDIASGWAYGAWLSLGSLICNDLHIRDNTYVDTGSSRFLRTQAAAPSNYTSGYVVNNLLNCNVPFQDVNANLLYTQNFNQGSPA